MTYEIGYRKPPASGQFKKGSSGNPKGRPKGSKNLMTILDQELEQIITVTENGKKKKMSRQQAMMKRLVASANQGDLKSMLAIIEIKRKSGSFDLQDAGDSMLPDNFEAVLDAYVQSRRSQD